MRPALRILLCALCAFIFIGGTIGSSVCFAQNGACSSASSSGLVPAGASLATNASSYAVPPAIVAAAPQPEESSSLLPASPAPAPPRSHADRAHKIGIGAKISLLGIGIEAATPLSHKLNLRGGFNFFNYNKNLTNDGIHYAGKIDFHSGEAHLDWFPFGGGFHLSPGLLFYNGNKITAAASVPAGQTFTLGGTQYQSDPSGLNPVTGNGSLTFPKAAPSFLIGFGNLLPRSGRHFSFNFEIGGEYQGAPKVALNLQGTACNTSTAVCADAASDPNIQSSIQSQEKKINHDLSPFKFFPQISLGFGINF